MDIVLKADKNVCEISGWQSNTGEVNARNLTVEMCEEMCSCAMAFVTFELNNGTIYESLVVESKAEIPEIKEPQFVKIGVYSADIENGKCVKRYSPHPTNAYINNGSYSGNGTEAPTPTAGTFEELLATINEVDEKTIKTLDRANVWELEAGVYYVSGNVFYATPQPPQSSNNIVLQGKKSTLFVTQSAVEAQTKHFMLFSDKYLYFGQSWFNALSQTAMGSYTKVVAKVSEVITEESTNEIPTAKAVYDYVQSVLPPSAEEVEY
jgi:hypothetical protein